MISPSLFMGFKTVEATERQSRFSKILCSSFTRAFGTNLLNPHVIKAGCVAWRTYNGPYATPTPFQELVLITARGKRLIVGQVCLSFNL